MELLKNGLQPHSGASSQSGQPYSCVAEACMLHLKANSFVSLSMLNYQLQRICGQGNIFAPVCHSVHRGGSPEERTPQAGRNPPAGRTPLAGRTPWVGNPPRQGDPPLAGNTPPLARENPQGRENPLGRETPGQGDPPGQGDSPGQGRLLWAGRPPGRETSLWQGIPPPGIQSMSGWYASYWNAFLF